MTHLPNRTLGSGHPAPASGAAPVTMDATALGETDAALMALLATGAAPEEAFCVLAQARPPEAIPALREAILPHLLAQFRHPDGTALHANRVLDRLDEVAKSDPELARMGLDAWGAGRRFSGGLSFRGLGWVTGLPEGMACREWLDLSETGILRLPEKLSVGGNLLLGGTPLTTIPKGLRVGQSLDLANTRIEHLPDGLRVGHHLKLNGTPIRALPKGLVVTTALELKKCDRWDGQVPEDAQLGSILTGGAFLSLEEWRAQHPQGARTDGARATITGETLP